MTAGMTTRSMEGSRISLPRAALGVLLAATLLAGSLLGAAVHAGITAATATSGAPAAHSSQDRAHAIPYRGDGFGGDGFGVTSNQSSSRTIPYRGDGFGGDGFRSQYRGERR